jgi:transcription elongation factor GreA
MSTFYISEEGLEKLKAELDGCMKQRMQVAATIETARELGDLKENGDYHAAKEHQAMLHAKISELEDKVANARVFNEDDIDASKVFIGATVRVLNKKTEKEFTYTLVSPVEADIEQGKFSVRSPVGQALLGKQVGDVAEAKAPAGTIKMEIIEITR